MSDDEIRSGARWSDVLAKSLDETNYGIICVTRENQHAPWLVFEAGALAKRLDSGRVVPLCIDLPRVMSQDLSRSSKGGPSMRPA